jgi:hypothetical protein
MRMWIALLLLGCRSEPEANPPADTGIEEEDVAPLPTLDPSKCGTVSGDEAPMVLDKVGPKKTLEEKLFPLFAAIAADAAVMEAVKTSLSTIAKPREDQWKTACADAKCGTWSEADATAAADALTLPAPFVEKLKTMGAFNAYPHDDTFVKKIVIDELLAASNAINAFNGELTADAKTKAAMVTRPSPMAFFEPVVALAVANLVGAKRDQAILYEPLESGENAAAIAEIPKIDFAKFPFAAILIPGLGPTDLMTPLSEGGQQRCDMALQRYAAKIAPLVVVSGGHVHPDRTPFSEAIEMKKYLVSKGMPASAVLVDPHARHTTTNLRNAGRLLLRHGVPPDRPVLITTDLFQSLYIVGRPFAIRCKEEIGYEPWRNLASLSVNDGCYFPSRITLTIDPRDPRDP